MKKNLFLCLAMAGMLFSCQEQKTSLVDGGSDLITYIGRTDCSQANKPKQWAAGGYFTFAFEGEACQIYLHNEFDWLNMEVSVDELNTMPIRLKGHKNCIVIGNAQEISDTSINVIKFDQAIKQGVHHVTITRNNETMHGYTSVDSIKADNIIKWTPQTNLKIEFIGNSITSGCDADTNYVPSNEYKWGDYHRAYYGYAPRTARLLNAQYSLASVSGIGLIHSCCEMEVVISDVYDKYIMRNNKIDYDFTDFTPDVICCCLGQNDGVQDNDTFIQAYVDFVKTLLAKNPTCKNIVLLSSPMADDTLRPWMETVMSATVENCKKEGIENISYLMFSKRWTSGAADHPSVEEHAEIAQELSNYLKGIIK